MSEQLAKEQLKRYAQALEASNEPGQFPSIQSAQSDAGQFNLEAAQSGAAQQGRYNPFEGQMITLPDGRVVPRTPENSLGGP